MSAAFSRREVWLFAGLLTASAVLRADEPVRSKLVLKTYLVADLMLFQDGTTRMKPLELIDHFVNGVAPHTWSTVSGPGTIDYFPLGMTLVISQTPEIQNQVADLLAAKRWVQKKEETVSRRGLKNQSLYPRILVTSQFLPPLPHENLVDFEWPKKVERLNNVEESQSSVELLPPPGPNR